MIKPNDISKFADAVRLRKELKLSPGQVDSLIFHANSLQGYKKLNPKISPKDYERKVLPTILDDSQYTSLLLLHYKDKAVAWAKDDWKELNERGIATGLDSVTATRQIINYNLAKWAISDRLGKAGSHSSPSIKSIETPMPEAMQRLRTARRYNNPIPDKASKAAFAW